MAEVATLNPQQLAARLRVPVSDILDQYERRGARMFLEADQAEANGADRVNGYSLAEYRRLAQAQVDLALAGR